MRTLTGLFVLMLLVTSCAGPQPQPAAAETLRSELPRESAPQLNETDLFALTTGNTAFAVDLYQQLRHGEENLFFSPHSISVALAMTYAGARGETATQMAQTLHFALPDVALHRAFNALDLLLTAQKGAEGSAEQPFELHIANSLWAEKEYRFLPEFLDLLAQHYGAGVHLVSFITAAEAARQAINTWVAEQTANRIQNLIPEGGVDALTRLVLANAIYFNAGWRHTFEKNLTREDAFTLLSGTTVNTPMMRWADPEPVPYAQGEGYQAIELPYRGGNASMVLIVPDAGRFAEFEATLTGEGVQRIIAGLQPRTVALTMPKFEVEAEFSLAQTLRALGMPAAFDPNQADFSGMDGARDLYIGDVFHKAFVSVDEAGTEAAAATAVEMKLESMPMMDVELTVDRPFIYLIRDAQSGAVLFMGRVMNPQ